MNELILVNAALALIEKLFPVINDAVKNGQVTPEAQAELRTRYTALRTQADAAFNGPEWLVEQISN